MKKLILILVLFVFGLSVTQGQSMGTVTDRRDGQSYRIRAVGKSVVMTENLRYAMPGDAYVYNNDTTHLAKFGRLYSFPAAQKACPKGWHLPSEKEWAKLIDFLGRENAGRLLQAMDTSGIIEDFRPDRYSEGSSSLLGGIRHPDGSCLHVGYWGGLWTSTSLSDSVAVNLLFVRRSPEAGFSSNDKQSGFSVRCMKK